MSIWIDFAVRYVPQIISNRIKTYFGFHSVFVKPCTEPPIFGLSVRSDYQNGHPRHFADELPDYLG